MDGGAGVPLVRFYEGWDRYNGLLVEALEPLAGGQTTLTTAEDLRPVWLLAAHIVSARVYWFHRVLGEGDPAIAPLQEWDDEGMPVRSGAELAGALRETWGLIDGCLRRWTAADLDRTFRTRRGATVTRQWVIWHVIEHDLHHGGELFFTLGKHGLPTPDL